MKYSRSICILLLGSDLFSPKMISSHPLKHCFYLNKNLDVFETLLFFFLYEENFSSSRFLDYFCGMKKISDLKERKQRFLDALSVAFEKLSQIEIERTPFFDECYRKKDTWKYKLSPAALKLKLIFFSELEYGAFWIENQRRGISVAYLGAYIYLMGICGKEEIDLSYCEKQKIIQDFNSGYALTGMRSTIRELVVKFSHDRIFSHGKRLENLNDQILHVRQENLSGVFYVEDKTSKRKNKVTRFKYWKEKENGVWKTRKVAEPYYINFRHGYDELSSLVTSVNSLETDFRYRGIHLRKPYYLEYHADTLDKLQNSRMPCNGIGYSDLHRITHGYQEECSVITIDYLYSLYMYRRLVLNRKNNSLKQPLVYGRSETTKALLVEKAWQVILEFTQNPEQQCKVFRDYLIKYTGSKKLYEVIESFFYYLTNEYFNLQDNLRKKQHIPTKQNFFNETISIFLHAMKSNDNQRIPSIASKYFLIVPSQEEVCALKNLAKSYQLKWGDPRRARFKITQANGRESYYHCQGSYEMRLVDQKWLPSCLKY